MRYTVRTLEDRSYVRDEVMATELSGDIVATCERNTHQNDAKWIADCLNKQRQEDVYAVALVVKFENDEEEHIYAAAVVASNKNEALAHVLMDKLSASVKSIVHWNVSVADSGSVRRACGLDREPLENELLEALKEAADFLGNQYCTNHENGGPNCNECPSNHQKNTCVGVRIMDTLAKAKGES